MRQNGKLQANDFKREGNENMEMAKLLWSEEKYPEIK
jgi:hypothetical protein